MPRKCAVLPAVVRCLRTGLAVCDTPPLKGRCRAPRALRVYLLNRSELRKPERCTALDAFWSGAISLLVENKARVKSSIFSCGEVHGAIVPPRVLRRREFLFRVKAVRFASTTDAALTGTRGLDAVPVLPPTKENEK